MTWHIRGYDPDEFIPDHRHDVHVWYEACVLHNAVHASNYNHPVDDEGGKWFRTAQGTMCYLPSIDLEYIDDGGNMLIVDACNDITKVS